MSTPKLKGMGTTCVALWFLGDKVVMGHVAPTPWVSAEAAHIVRGCQVDHDVAEMAGAAAVAQAISELPEQIRQILSQTYQAIESVLQE